MKSKSNCLPSAHRASGFTLLELMIVLVIMSVFSTMIVPSIVTAVRSSGAVATGAKLQDMLDFACMSAVTRHRSVVVNIDPKRRICWVAIEAVRLPWVEEQQEVDAPAAITLAAMELPEGITVTVTREEQGFGGMAGYEDWETLTYGSNGSTVNANIELADARGQRYQIEIIGVTGETHGKEPTE